MQFFQRGFCGTLTGLFTAVMLTFGTVSDAYAAPIQSVPNPIIVKFNLFEFQLDTAYAAYCEEGHCDKYEVYNDCTMETDNWSYANFTCYDMLQPATIWVHITGTSTSSGEEPDAWFAFCAGSNPEIDFTYAGGEGNEDGGCDGGSSGGGTGSGTTTSCVSDDWSPMSGHPGGGDFDHGPGQYWSRIVRESNGSSCDSHTEYACGSLIDPYDSTSKHFYGIAKYDEETAQMSGCKLCPDGQCCGVIVDKNGELFEDWAEIHVSQGVNSCQAGYSATSAEETGYVELPCSANGVEYNYLTAIPSPGYVPLIAAELQTPDDDSWGCLHPTMSDSDLCKYNFKVTINEDSGTVSCTENQWRDYSGGSTVCRNCPSYNGIQGVVHGGGRHSIPYWGNLREVDCQIPTYQKLTDERGTFTYRDACTLCTNDK